MALITIVAHNNEHTINFDKPIPQLSRVRLISASFYNSWNVLKSAVEIALTTKDKKQFVVSLPPGHYNIESMAKKLTELFIKNDMKLSMGNHLVGGIHIHLVGKWSFLTLKNTQ